MAAGIAHEVSNPLGTVLGYAELLLKYDLPDDVKSDLKTVERGAQRAASILDRLLTFAGQQNGEHEVVGIEDTIDSAIEFRKYSFLSNGIDVIKKIDDKLPRIMANSSQLQEVFLNILLNAESSIVEARSKGSIVITGKADSDYLYISLTDDGTGISSENQSKIFNPFFTTKGVGKGTGLGLSICHGIINSHGGEILVESEPGTGSTFTIKLPAIKSNRKAIQYNAKNE
jgi:signal transduction histidine kinase